MRFLLLMLILITPVASHAETIHLLAAGSLRELAVDVKAVFERQHPDQRVLVNSASSGVLARQVAAGAPADLFLSANSQWMDELVKQGKVAPDQPVPWLSNRLVVVGRGAALADLRALRTFDRLAIGSPQSVPAGRYARAMLQAAGLYVELEAGHRLVMVKDVHQALAYADQGVVDGAIVYASDARRARQSPVLLVPEEGVQPQIVYPIALTRQGQQKPAALDLHALLLSAEGARLAAAYGFSPVAGRSPRQ